jgi:exonuclease III
MTKSSCRWRVQLAQLEFFLIANLKSPSNQNANTNYTYKIQFSKTLNTSQMLTFPSFSIHYSTILAFYAVLL